MMIRLDIMKRTQIQLEENVFAALREKAFQEKISLAKLIRMNLHQTLFSVKTKRSARLASAFSFVGAGKYAKKDSASEKHDETLAQVILSR